MELIGTNGEPGKTSCKAVFSSNPNGLKAKYRNDEALTSSTRYLDVCNCDHRC